jgi:large subunit ribosomal protein L22
VTGPKLNEGATVAGERAGTKATAKYVRSSASKARVVLDLIRGLDARRADEVLQFTERGIARDIRKVLASAVANAVHNDEQDADELFVLACFADEGPTLKRFRPRARGRATRVRKRTCHITVVVARMSDERIAVVQARQAGARGGRGGRPTSSAASRRARVERSRQRAQAAAAGTTTNETPAVDEDAVDTTEELAEEIAEELEAEIDAVEAEEAAEDEAEAEAEDTDADVADAEDTEDADGTPGEGSASDEPDAARGGNEVDDEPAIEQGSASDDADEEREVEDVNTRGEGSASDEAEPSAVESEADDKEGN